MRNFVIALLLSGLSWQTPALAQPSERLEELTIAWENALSKGDFMEAYQWHDQACNLARDKNLLARWIELKSARGMVMAEQQKSQYEGWNYVEKSLKDMWRPPTGSDESYELCYLYLYHAYVAKQYDEDFVRTKAALESAYRIFHQALEGQDNDIAAFLFYQLGNAYVRLREFNSAKKIFEEALAYSIRFNAPEVAKYNDHAGMYLTMGDYHQAKKIFQEGIARENMSEEDWLFTRLGLVECLANLQEVERGLALNREIEKSLGKRINSKELRQKLPEFSISLQENYALLYEKKGNLANAMHWYLRAYQTAEAYPKSARRSLGFYLSSIGNLYLEQKKGQSALEYYQKALQAIIPGLPSSVESNPGMAALSAETVVLKALYGKAQAFKLLGQSELALSCYELIPIVEAKLRATHVYENSSLMALRESRARFEEAISLAWQLYEKSNAQPAYAERAFRLSELSRGMLLLQSLMQARQYLPEDIKNREYELKAQMAWLELEMAREKEKGQEGNLANLSIWEQQLFELKLERQRLLADFPSYSHPDSAVLQVLEARKVLDLLKQGQALVSYFQTDMEVFVFVFEPESDFKWRKWTLPDNFQARTQSFIQYLWDNQENGRDAFLQEAYWLYQHLIAPECAAFKKNITNLILVPDGVLMMLPFEVLLTSDYSSGRPNWRDQPWLLWQYNVSYGYSATLLKAQTDIRRQNTAGTPSYRTLFGGFAPNYSESGSYHLQNTGGMVKNIHMQLGGDVWRDEPALETVFKERAADYRILLLAMHGISHPDQPELSRLLFGDPGPDSLANNNILYASELQIMQLQADLVVLSACHSGSGKLEQGEGVYSLARAFAAAGVPATVMSLWLLHENAAPPLVESFFSFLKQGMTKDEALRQSKQVYLQSDANFEMTHPFYWAGLVVAGDMEPIAISHTISCQWWLVLPGLLVLSLGWLWMKKRTNPDIQQ